MARENVARKLFREVGFYKKSFMLYVVLGVLVFGGYQLYNSQIKAVDPSQEADTGFLVDTSNTNTVDLYLKKDGYLYSGKRRISNAEYFTSGDVYRVRYQVLRNTTDTIDQLIIAVHLPSPATEDNVTYRFAQNNGAYQVESVLTDSQTIIYTAYGISQEAMLSIELQVPKSFVTTSYFTKFREAANALNPLIWTSLSVALPVITLVLLLVVSISKYRRSSVPRSRTLNQPPTQLRPALLEIMLKGRLTSKGLASTFLDLARRGHIVITQYEMSDFRFTRKQSSDKLDPFEQELLEQLFGADISQVNDTEINISLAQEVFSQRVSASFRLAYEEMQDLGYFYADPLSLHRRYLITSFITFALGLIGFAVNLLIYSDVRFSLLFWIGMILSSFLINSFSKDLPSRTVLGNQELMKWLAFSNYLSEPKGIQYTAYSRDQYLSFLPYAIIFDYEVEWTKRFYNLPFAVPGWYVTSNVSTVDEFANKVFPLFGYLSYNLAITVKPTTR